MTDQPKTVYQAIAAVQGELSRVGIAKNRRNTQGTGYNFRGIDDVYAALAPLLAKEGLCIIPRMIERIEVERQSQKGNALFYITVKAEFDFVSVADGSTHTASTYGEAMDSGDKATNKAMSAAYKYAAFLTFAIPTEGDNDTENVTHEVTVKEPAARDAPFPQGPCKNKTELKAKGRDLWREVEGCGDADELDVLLIAHKDLQQQLAAALPAWWSGGTRDGEPYDGLATVIANKQTAFANEAWKQNPVSGG